MLGLISVQLGFINTTLRKIVDKLWTLHASSAGNQPYFAEFLHLTNRKDSTAQSSLIGHARTVVTITPKSKMRYSNDKRWKNAQIDNHNCHSHQGYTTALVQKSTICLYRSCSTLARSPQVQVGQSVFYRQRRNKRRGNSQVRTVFDWVWSGQRSLRTTRQDPCLFL